MDFLGYPYTQIYVPHTYNKIMNHIVHYNATNQFSQFSYCGAFALSLKNYYLMVYKKNAKWAYSWLCYYFDYVLYCECADISKYIYHTLWPLFTDWMTWLMQLIREPSLVRGPLPASSWILHSVETSESKLRPGIFQVR